MRTFTSRHSDARKTELKVCDDLIRLIKTGDEKAFSKFAKIMKNVLSETANRMLGNPSDAEEVVSDILLLVWGGKARFNAAKGTCFGLLVTATRRQAIDKLRYNATREKARDAYEEEQSIGNPNIDDSWQDLYTRDIYREARKLVENTSIPKKQRDVVKLCLLQGMSIREAAKHLRIPRGTATRDYYSGLKKMKSFVAESPFWGELNWTELMY